MDDEVAKTKAQKKTNALFVLACARGYIEDVSHFADGFSKFLKLNLQSRYCMNRGLSCLSHEIGLQQVHALLEKGADPNAKDKRGVSALHYACGQGRLEAVKLLWSKGMELDSEDPGGNLPLHYAVTSGKHEVVKFLLEKGAWVEASNAVDDTVLHIAARQGRAGILEDILDNGGKAVLKEVNKRGLSAIGEAIVCGKVGAAKVLSQAGAVLGERPQGWSLLHLAVTLQQTASSAFLINHAGNVNDANNVEGSTALHCAAAAGSLPLAEMLIQAGADLALADAAGRQPADLVPAGKDKLKKALHTSAPPKTAIKGATGLKSDIDLFKEASDAEKMAQIEKWADQAQSSRLEKQLLEFPAELRKQILELQKLYEARNIQQGLVELLEDDDFQRLATDAKATALVAEVHGNREAFKKYADNDVIMGLLRKLHRFQAVVRANGHHQVPYQSLLRNAEPAYREKSGIRLKGMEIMVARRKQAALAAALAENEEEAQEKAKWWLDPGNHPARQHQSSQPALTPLQNAAPKDGNECNSRPDTGERQQEFLPLRSRSAPHEDDTALPPLEPFTWQRFYREMWRSLVRSVVISALFVVVVYSLTGKPPWQLVDYVADPSLLKAKTKGEEL